MVKAKGWANWSLAGLKHKSCVARLTGSLAHALPALMSNRCHTLLQCFRRVLPFTTGRQQNLGSCGAFLIQWQVIILGLVSMLLSPYCSVTSTCFAFSSSFGVIVIIRPLISLKIYYVLLRIITFPIYAAVR